MRVRGIKPIRIISLIILMILIIPFDLFIILLDDIQEERAKKKWLKENLK